MQCFDANLVFKLYSNLAIIILRHNNVVLELCSYGEVQYFIVNKSF